MGLAGIGLLVMSYELGAKSILGGMFMSAIAVAIIWKTTRNYLNREKSVAPLED